MLSGVFRQSQPEADHAGECREARHQAWANFSCQKQFLVPPRSPREALLEHFEPLPFEVLKVLCAKVCYLDVGVPELHVHERWLMQ